MAPAAGPGPVSLACLSCGTPGRLTSPDDDGGGGLAPGAVVICGQCATVHRLEAAEVFNRAADRLEWTPYLRRPVLEELEALRADPRVKPLLDAYELAAMERRIARAGIKQKPGGLRLVDGDRLELEGYGPDYRGPRPL